MAIDVLVVGAGFAGSILAERFASAGKSVLVIDKRLHIAGNAYDEYDDHGILVHRYGPHAFHTNSQQVFDYLSRFTDWRHYEHRALASVNGVLYPFPINQTTINRLYNLNLDEQGVADYLHSVQVPCSSIRTSEDLVLSQVGHDLCDKFFRNYTRKQWGLELSQLSATVAGRIPVRTNSDDRYFTDSFQAMPQDGYTKMFERILQHKNIRVELGTKYFKDVSKIRWNTLVWTGCIDDYFFRTYGPLPYRSLCFDYEHLNFPQYQQTGVVNYPNNGEITRIIEFKHLTGQQHQGTTIMREYPSAKGDPYYPIPCSESAALYQKYKALADAEKNVIFIGRLAQYRYYNMDQVVAAALQAAKEIL